MNERTVVLLRAVQKTFFLVLFVILALSSNSLAGTFMFAPATGDITCYDGAGNVITCPPDGDPMALTYTDAVNSAVTESKAGRKFEFVHAKHQITYYDGAGNAIACPPEGNPVTQDDSNLSVPSTYTGKGIGNPYLPHMADE